MHPIALFVTNTVFFACPILLIYYLFEIIIALAYQISISIRMTRESTTENAREKLCEIFNINVDILDESLRNLILSFASIWICIFIRFFE